MCPFVTFTHRSVHSRGQCYTQILTSNLPHNIYYLLLLHVLATTRWKCRVCVQWQGTQKMYNITEGKAVIVQTIKA
jgi:hypothetical protein